MRRPLSMFVPFAGLVIFAAAAHAQDDRAARFLDNCRNNHSRDNEEFCEVRNFTMAAGRTLSVDGRENGGITVHGWDGAGIKVLAFVQAQAETEADAAATAHAVSVTPNGSEILATGPESRNGRQWWSVSYEIWAPRHTDLTLTASNGGLSVDGIESRMALQTVNGGLKLTDIGGDVHGATSNGGVTAELSGDRWSGAGLDLQTSNGGVRVSVPANYSAQLETGTVHGKLNVDFPMTVQGAIGRHVSTTLGSGGPLIRLTTTNGGVSVVRR
jgi:putative adhesin